MSGDIVVRYWAAAKAAAGVAEERFSGAPDLAALLDDVRARHIEDPRLAEVLRRCSYLVDEVSPGLREHTDVTLKPGSVVDVLPPFAGGSGDTPPGSSTASGTRRVDPGLARS